MERKTKQTESVVTAIRSFRGAYFCGYDVLKITGLKSGTVYPILKRFEDNRVIIHVDPPELRTEDGPRKKWYVFNFY